MKDFVNAWKSLSENIQLCGDSCADRVVLHIRYAAGTIQLGLKEFDKAEQEFLASYELSKRVRNVRMVLDNIYNLSDLRRRDNDIEKALTYLGEAEGIIQTVFRLIAKLSKYIGGFLSYTWILKITRRLLFIR